MMLGKAVYLTVGCSPSISRYPLIEVKLIQRRAAEMHGDLQKADTSFIFHSLTQ